MCPGVIYPKVRAIKHLHTHSHLWLCTLYITTDVVMYSVHYHRCGNVQLTLPQMWMVMYAVHASIVLPRSLFTPLKSMGGETLRNGDSQILYTGTQFLDLKWLISLNKWRVYFQKDLNPLSIVLRKNAICLFVCFCFKE